MKVSTEKATVIPAENDRLLTTKEAAAVLGVATQTLSRARVYGTAGYPPYIKIAKSVRYRLSTLLHWIDGHREQQCTGTHN